MTLEDITTADRTKLLSVWTDMFGTPAPKGLSQNMLRRFLAFELQAKRHGGLSKSALKQLLHPPADKAKTKTPALKPGGRLVREWNGTAHIVEVTEEGFMWREQKWRSLSVIAREITGAHWSGPRFFGLAKARP